MDHLREKVKELERLNVINGDEINELTIKLKSASGVVEHFNAGSRVLDEILECQRPPSDRTGLGFHAASSNSMDEKTTGMTTHTKRKEIFVKNLGRPTAFLNQKGEAKTKTILNPITPIFFKLNGHTQKTIVKNFIHVCHYCGKKGHIRPNCFQLYGYPAYFGAHQDRYN